MRFQGRFHRRNPRSFIGFKVPQIWGPKLKEDGGENPEAKPIEICVYTVATLGEPSLG
jgi:hypothetical protein